MAAGNDTTLRSAIEAWKEAIGSEKVLAASDEIAPYVNSVCGSCRDIPCVLRPESTEDVQKIIEAANRFQVPLYPVSCGHQWGMGSRLPVKDGTAVVDLGGMNRIIEISEKFHYAVVEPGVTQRQLVDYIEEHNLPLMLNVTGSSSGTSLIGNAMDRGVGYFDSRAHGICNMTVVLGNGETVKTGFGHYAGAKPANLYQPGVGPDLAGLFPQGNFGIVTSACIDLMPMPEAHMAVIVKIDREDKLGDLIDALGALRRRGVYQTVSHVGNRERSFITLSPLIYEQLIAHGGTPGPDLRAEAVKMLEQGGFGPWSAAVGVLGSKAQLRLAKKEFRKALGGFSKVMFLDDRAVGLAKAVSAPLSFIPYVRRQRIMLLAVEPVYNYTRGEPTDKSLKSVYWGAGDFDRLDEPDPDQSDSGILFCVPILPVDGGEVCSAVRMTREVCGRYGFEAAITVNLICDKASEAVISISFDRRNQERASAAHNCISELENACFDAGFPLFRFGINSMQNFIREDDPFWRTVRDLKQTLDPNHIIAPGRYNLV